MTNIADGVSSISSSLPEPISQISQKYDSKGQFYVFLRKLF